MYKYKYLFISMFLILFAVVAQAKIPEIIEKYLVTNKNNIIKDVPREYLAHDMKMLALNIADKLINRYVKYIEIPCDPQELKNEVVAYILSQIFTDFNITTKTREGEDILRLADLRTIDFIPGEERIIRVSYEGVQIPLKVEVYIDKIVFKIVGSMIKLEGSMSLSKSDCFWLSYFPRKEKAELEWLGTIESACPIPANRQGEFLLTLAEKLASAMGAKKIELEDDSSIFCPSRIYGIKFRTLRIFQGKKGWYESQGYRPKNEQEATTIEQEQRLLKSLKLSDIDRNLSLLTSPNAEFQNALEIFKSQKSKFMMSESSDLFADFMKWLWEQDCSQYIAVYNLIFYRTKLIEPEKIRKWVPKFVKQLGEK